jgi:chromosome segregation ATPase
MTSEQRLQRLEDEFEIVKDLLTSTARYAESANRELVRVVGALERLAESQATSQAAWDERFRQMSEAQAASQAVLDERFRQVSETQIASQAALDAQLGQLGRSQAETERQLGQISETQAATEKQAERLFEAQAATEAQLERTTQRLDEFIFQVQRLLSKDAEHLDIVEGRIERLEAIAQRLDRNYEAQQAQFQEFQITTRASQERQERVLEYLLRRDGETR